MEQLKEAYILALATVKSDMADLKKNYDTLLQEKNIIQNVMIQLKEQRNIINNEYKILENETDKKMSILQKEVKEKEIEVDVLQNNIHILKSESNQERLELQHKLITCYEELNASSKKLMACQEELNMCNKELIASNKKVMACQEELNASNKKLMARQEELHRKENELIKLVEKEELLTLRKALTTFEKFNINVDDPSRRSECWCAYFEDVKPREVLEKVGFNGNLKDTVRALFLRMNAMVHQVYPLDEVMTIRASTISPDEQKLIRALWQLSPLRKGCLEIVSNNE